jgi:hypothetical protein
MVLKALLTTRYALNAEGTEINNTYALHRYRNRVQAVRSKTPQMLSAMEATATVNLENFTF